MLIIATLYDDAYSVAVLEEIEQCTKRPNSIGAVHRSMQRLEEKGMVKSRFGEASAERGSRRKRLFTVTPAGERALKETRALRNGLWNAIPETAFEGGLS